MKPKQHTHAWNVLEADKADALRKAEARVIKAAVKLTTVYRGAEDAAIDRLFRAVAAYQATIAPTKSRGRMRDE